MDPKVFDKSVVDPAHKILAWDLNLGQGERTLSVFALDQGGARQIAWRQYAEGKRETISSDFVVRGFTIGTYDSLGGPFVWVVKQDEVLVWDESSQVLTAKNDIIRFAAGRTLAVDDIGAIVAYVDEEYVDRGVKARLKSGQLVTLLFHLSMGASGNPTYSRNDLLMDSAWCNSIARAVADWAKVSYVDEI